MNVFLKWHSKQVIRTKQQSLVTTFRSTWQNFRYQPFPLKVVWWKPCPRFLLTWWRIAAHSPATSQEEDPDILGQGHMTWQQLWFDSFWKSLKGTQAGPWEWDQVNLQDTWTWETILKGMLKISKETLEDLTFQSRTPVPVFSRQTDIMLFDFCIQNIIFWNFFMRVLKRQRLLRHPI